MSRPEDRSRTTEFRLPSRSLLPIGDRALAYTRTLANSKNGFQALMAETHRVNNSNEGFYTLLNLCFDESLGAAPDPDKNRGFFLEGAMYVHIALRAQAKHLIPSFPTRESVSSAFDKETTAMDEFANNNNIDREDIGRIAYERVKQLAKKGADGKGSDSKLGKALLAKGKNHPAPLLFLAGAITAYATIRARALELEQAAFDHQAQAIAAAARAREPEDDAKVIAQFEQSPHLVSLRRSFGQLEKLFVDPN